MNVLIGSMAFLVTVFSAAQTSAAQTSAAQTSAAQTSTEAEKKEGASLKSTESAVQSAAVANPKKQDENVDNNDLDFVQGNDTLQVAPEEKVIEDEEIKDATPPTIDDLAVAATNPDATPFATGVFSDDNSGIEKALIYVRATGAEEFKPVSFDAGEGGMFMALLPNGLQSTGFDYYVEVNDAAGNAAQMGSEEKPFYIQPAGESALAQYKAANAQKAPYVVHPAWAMLSLGVGIAGLAAAGGLVAFVVRGVNVQTEWQQELSRNDLTGAQRIEAETALSKASNAIIIDASAAGVLGVLGTAALATGVSLLVVNGLE